MYTGTSKFFCRDVCAINISRLVNFNVKSSTFLYSLRSTLYEDNRLLGSVSFTIIISCSFLSCLTSKLLDKFRQLTRKGGAKCHADLFAPAAPSRHPTPYLHSLYVLHVCMYFYFIYIFLFLRALYTLHLQPQARDFAQRATRREKSMTFNGVLTHPDTV